MPPSDPQIAALRAIANRTMYSWTQAQVDTAIAYLHSKGWRPCKSTMAKGPIVAHQSNISWEVRQTMNEIHDARFMHPSQSASCGAQKALKRQLRASRSNILARKMISDARIALAKGDVGKVQDLLDQLYRSLGG